MHSPLCSLFLINCRRNIENDFFFLNYYREKVKPSEESLVCFPFLLLFLVAGVASVSFSIASSRTYCLSFLSLGASFLGSESIVTSSLAAVSESELLDCKD